MEAAVDVPSTETVMEERVGWRQKSLEPRPPRPKRPERTDRAKFKPVQAEGETPHKGKSRNDRGHERGDRKPGQKPGGKPEDKNERNRGPRPERKPAEPYVNPYSPFAVLLGKIT